MCVCANVFGRACGCVCLASLSLCVFQPVAALGQGRLMDDLMECQSYTRSSHLISPSELRVQGRMSCEEGAVVSAVLTSVCRCADKGSIVLEAVNGLEC